MPFSEAGLVSVHNTVLADGLGNLAHRALALAHRCCHGRVPAVAAAAECLGGPEGVRAAVAETCAAMDAQAVVQAASIAERLVRETNKYLTDTAPWAATVPAPCRDAAIRAVLEALYVIAHLFEPFVPTAALRLLRGLGHAPRRLDALAATALDNLTPGTNLALPASKQQQGAKGAPPAAAAAAEFGVLFQRLVPVARVGGPGAGAGGKAAVGEGGGGGGVVGREGEGEEGGAVVTRLDLRVGKVVSCEEHPNADALYVVKVEVGEPSVRTVVAGLAKFLPPADLLGRLVAVVCNIKPCVMRGVASTGLLLVASDAQRSLVEPLEAPTGSHAGEHVMLEQVGLMKPSSSDAVLKSKAQQQVWKTVAAELRLVQGVATYQGHRFIASTGPLTCRTLRNASVG